MKIKNLLFVLTLAPVLFAGCDKDKESAQGDAKNIEGTYKGEIVITFNDPSFEEQRVPDFSIKVAADGEVKAKLSIETFSVPNFAGLAGMGETIAVPAIDVSCDVSYANGTYSLNNGKQSINLTGMPVPIEVTVSGSVKESTLTLNIGVLTLPIKFTGEKQ